MLSFRTDNVNLYQSTRKNIYMESDFIRSISKKYLWNQLFQGNKYKDCIGLCLVFINHVFLKHIRVRDILSANQSIRLSTKKGPTFSDHGRGMEASDIASQLFFSFF